MKIFRNKASIENTGEFLNREFLTNNYIGLHMFMKEIFDRTFSLIMLFLLFPIFFIISILIKLDSRGPVLFFQERVGLNSKKFWIIKFRTMRKNAEKEKENLKIYNEASGPMFKIKKDPRITRVGKILRKTGIDETPQLFNVLRGEMSIIGPRPPLEEEIASFEKWQLRKVSIKPGITGKWQVHPDRHNVNFEEWVRMDLDYIDNWTLKEDFKIFFQSMKTVLSASGH